MQRQLNEGLVTYEQPQAGALHLIIDGLHEMAATIYRLDWTVLDPSRDEFITSDRPISMFDPAPPHPWSGHAWRSSPEAIAFYPMSPRRGLFLTPGDCGLHTGSSVGDQMRRLNLMTFGGAERRVFGTETALAKVVREAREHPDEIIERRPATQVICVPPALMPESVRAEHAEKGWPLTIHHTEKGEVGYFAVGEDAAPGDIARLITEMFDRG